MADDEDHGDNRPDDMILDEKVVKMGEELASIMRKRKGLNEEAKTIYSNADKLGIPPAALQVAADLNPRSDPKRGGAGKGRKPKATVAETATVDPATLNAAQEQVDGGAVLDGMIDGIPKSQSQIAREIAEQAGTDK
jgi:hypothetical protein